MNRKPMRTGMILPLLFIFFAARAQVTVTTPYPAAAQSLTRGLDTSLLTVEVNFLGACSNNVVTINLASGVTYVPASVTKTGGNAGITIADLGGIASAPTYAINGVTGAGSITFTIKRVAACGNTASGKDAVSVTGSCGSVTENNASVNSYNLLSPSLSITPPAALTNAVVGTTATRTTTITNGGNGALDTLRYYVVYTSGGIVNTSGTNAITANGTSFTPSSTNGDTLFYKIYGAALFGGDNLLSNGETVTITEPIKVAKCNAATAYGAGWGKTKGTQCQVATATSAVTMANGVPILTTSIVENTVMSACTPGSVTVTFANTGSGGSAGAMYNIITQLGNLNPNSPNIVFGPTSTAGSNTSAAVIFNNFMINGVPITVTQTGTGAWIVDMSQFATDPDGAGGLTDLDGDGQFDDLAPGASIVITMKREYQLFTQCVIPDYYRRIGAKATFNTMCGTVTTPLATQGGTTAQSTGHSVTATSPSLVAGGTPFTVRFCHAGFDAQGFSLPTDSLYLKLDLPAGVTYVAGSGQYNGGAATITSSGSTLYISAKRNGVSLFCFNADFVYACGTSGNIVIPYEIYHVLARSCNALESFKCGSVTIGTKCPLPCPTGMANYSPTAMRTNYGWTNTTMTTKVDPATLTSLARKSATVYDTVEIIQPGKQSGTYNNLYYSYQMDKASGADAVKFESGTINFKAGGTGPTISCPMPAYTNMGTATLTKWVFNLSPLMGGACGFPATLTSGDSVWIDMKLSVTNANSNKLFSTTLTSPPNQLSYMYNLDASSVEQNCDKWAPDFYLVGLNNVATTYYAQSPFNLTGCTPVTTSFVNYGFSTNEAGDVFPAEYRPTVSIDSIAILFPAGISWTGTMPTMIVDTFSAPYSLKVNTVGTTATMSGNRLVLKNFGTGYFSDLLPANYTHYHNTYFEVAASCAAAATSNFVVTTYGKSFVYAGANIPFVSTYSGTGASLTANYDVTTKPNITVQNNTGVVQGVQNQQYWDVQINSTGTTTAPYLWLALEKSTGSGGVSIDSVVLKPGNVVLTPSTYNTTDHWYQVSTAGLTSGSVQQARVYFKYTSCTLDSILLKAGWNCTGYPSPDPLTGYACTAAQTYLKVDPKPSQVQLSVARQPGGGSSIDLCTTDSTLLIVNSAQAANLENPYVTFYPPAGVTLSSSIQVEYPLGSGNYQPATVTSIGGGGYKIDLTAHTAIGSNGIPGTASANPSFTPLGGDRQAKIKLQINTDCSFVSGSQLDFFVYGNKPCGTVADGNGTDVKSNPVNINGATTTGNAVLNMSIATGSTLTCGNTASIGMAVTEVGTSTASGDTAVYTLPAGLGYAGNFTGCNCAITTVTGIAGTTLVKVTLPVNLPSGTTTSYSFDVTPTGGGCGTVYVNGHVERNTAPLNCGAVTCTTSKVIIGTATPQSITLSKPIIAIQNLTVVSGQWVSGGTATVALTYANTGSVIAPAGPYAAEIFCGSNTTPFNVHTLAHTLAPGTAATDTFSVNIPAGCANGSTVTVKAQAVMADGTQQCLCSPSAYVYGGYALPIHFSQANITANGCKVTINWSYEVTGTTVQSFDIRRSNDGIHFNTIATLPATATSFTDIVNNRGNQQYRILANETDGKQTGSKLLQVYADCTGNNQLEVYPNPISSGGTLSAIFLSATARTNVQLKCIDITGRIITHNTVSLASGNNLLHVHAPAAAGMYLLQITDEQGHQLATPVRFTVQ